MGACPLASPKPSAGQFYLDNSGLATDLQLATNREEPVASWGSKADTGTHPRPIRGRKFYWRTDPPTSEAGRDRTRGRKRLPHHTEEMGARTVQLIPVDTEFTTTVTFENLGSAEIGALAAAIAPARLWPDLDVVIGVGGGKPFGFGSVTATIEDVVIETARTRYLGTDADAPTLDDCITAFAVGSEPGSATAMARQHWDALRNVLTLGYVDDDLVWYPPGDGTRGTPEYDQGFEFWKKSSGATVSVKDGGVKYAEKRQLVSTPSPSAPPEEQVLRLKVSRVRLGDGGRRA